MTTVLSSYELAHLVQVVTDNRARPRAQCSCGWAGGWTDDPAGAVDAAVDHREVAVGPPTDLDAALSGLLDLQDDLAEVVMWLAENWSADLPTPHVTSACRYRDNADALPGVRLHICCGTRHDLDRLADLLGAPIAADAEPNSLGHRYERTIRRFGRVELDAYRALDPDTGAVP
jgi:hypothetical protein